MPFEPDDFWNKYELIQSSASFETQVDKLTVCRYCGKSIAETTFEQKTHLLPELLGENTLLTNDECDECNNFFSGYETHLSTFIRPYVTLLGIKGKTKVPDFQSRTVNNNEQTRTVLTNVNPNYKKLVISSLEDYKIDTQKKTFELTFRKPPFVPLKVYKSLLKISLSLMPTGLDAECKPLFDWLRNKRDFIDMIPHAFITTLKRKSFAAARAELYRAKVLKEDDVVIPEFTLVLYFANQVIQIFLPFTIEILPHKKLQEKLELILFPAFIFDDYKNQSETSIKVFDLGLENSIKEDQKIFFKYAEADIGIDSNTTTQEE